MPEASRAKAYLRRLGYVSRETVPVPELNFLGLRAINLLLKDRETQKGYPRIWKKIKDSLSQWKR